MGKVSKVVVDIDEGGNSLFYLPLDRLMNTARQAEPISAGDAERLRQATEDLRERAADTRRHPRGR